MPSERATSTRPSPAGRRRGRPARRPGADRSRRGPALLRRAVRRVPGLPLEVLELTTGRDRAAVRWRAHGTFAGPGDFQGFVANGAKMTLEGCDVLTVRDDLIRTTTPTSTAATSPVNWASCRRWARAEARLTSSRTHGRRCRHAQRGRRRADRRRGLGRPRRLPDEDDERVPDRGRRRRHVFDAGVRRWAARCGSRARLGGAKRVVLGHADADHRGAAPRARRAGLLPPGRAAAAESPTHGATTGTSRSSIPTAASAAPVAATWDGGAVAVAGHGRRGRRDRRLPGDRSARPRARTDRPVPGVRPPGAGVRLRLHARSSDRAQAAADVPHPAFDADVEQARASIRKLAELEPSAVWPGHGEPVTGDVSGSCAPPRRRPVVTARTHPEAGR